MPGLHEWVGEFPDPDFAARVLAGADGVVTTVHPMGGDLESQRRIGVEGTTTFAQAAADAGVPMLVHISTAAVYDRSPGMGDVDESSPLVGDDAGDYPVTKRDLDAALAGIDGITRVLIRPPAILGPGDTSVWNTLRPAAIRDHDRARHAIPDQTFSWVHVDDLGGFAANLATGNVPSGPPTAACTSVNVAGSPATVREYPKRSVARSASSQSGTTPPHGPVRSSPTAPPHGDGSPPSVSPRPWPSSTADYRADSAAQGPRSDSPSHQVRGLTPSRGVGAIHTHGSMVDVGALALWADDEDEVHRSVDGAEPARGPCGEFCCFAGVEEVGVVAEQQTQASVDHLHPVVAFVHLHRLRGRPSSGGDVHLVGVEAAGAGPIGQRPHRQTVEASGWLSHPRVRRWRGAEQVVGADAQRVGEKWDVIERQASLAGLEPAKRGQVDVGALGHLLERQALFALKCAQALPHSSVKISWVIVCRRDKKGCRPRQLAAHAEMCSAPGTA